jgi:TPR repeat protein
MGRRSFRRRPALFASCAMCASPVLSVRSFADYVTMNRMSHSARPFVWLVFACACLPSMSWAQRTASTRTAPEKSGVKTRTPVLSGSLLRACNAGNAVSCLKLAEMYRSGQGVTKNLARASALYMKACDGDVAEGCLWAGRLFESADAATKETVSTDEFIARAISLWTQACDRHELDQCMSLGDYFQHESGGSSDASRAYGKACKAGRLDGCTRQGQVLFTQHTKKSYGKALDLLRKACDGGDAEGCGTLGLMHLYGRGVPENATLAAPLLLKGCNGGNGSHCNAAGMLYFRGRGVPNDDRTAFGLFKKGCEQKPPSPEACTSLADFYVSGQLVRKDLKKARSLYRIGCRTTLSVTKERACKEWKSLSSAR